MSQSGTGTLEFVGPEGYTHGWIFHGLSTDFKTADKMSKGELAAHLADHHGGPGIGGRAVGPKNPGKSYLLATHEKFHADAARGNTSQMSTEHSHGMGRSGPPGNQGLGGSETPTWARQIQETERKTAARIARQQRPRRPSRAIRPQPRG